MGAVSSASFGTSMRALPSFPLRRAHRFRATSCRALSRLIVKALAISSYVKSRTSDCTPQSYALTRVHPGRRTQHEACALMAC